MSPFTLENPVIATYVAAAGRARLDRIRRGAQADFARRLAALEPGELATLDAGLEVLRRIGGAT